MSSTASVASAFRLPDVVTEGGGSLWNTVFSPNFRVKTELMLSPKGSAATLSSSKVSCGILARAALACLSLAAFWALRARDVVDKPCVALRQSVFASLLHHEKKTPALSSASTVGQ